MRPSEIPHQSAVRLAAEIRAGGLSAVEIASAFIARIDAHDHRVGALAHFDRAAALREAADSDRALATGRPIGPLHGVPMTLKDAFRAAGSRSSFGVPYLKFYRPAADSEVVARIRQAGAILLGRTKVPFACFEWQCRPPLARECVNPIDPGRTCGGSSSGAAAALAARF